MAKDIAVDLHRQGVSKPGKGVDGADVNVASLILSQAFVNWHKAFMKVLDPYKLTYSQWIILRTLVTFGAPMSPSELNKYLTIEGTSISVLIDGIEERGFIRRRRSRVDRRMVKVNLTEQGQELLSEIDPQISRLIEKIYGLLSEAERKQLITLCRKVRDASVENNGGNPDIVEAILMKFSGAGC
jgi:DNA-binding MarR family transcriptional regulator